MPSRSGMSVDIAHATADARDALYKAKPMDITHITCPPEFSMPQSPSSSGSNSPIGLTYSQERMAAHMPPVHGRYTFPSEAFQPTALGPTPSSPLTLNERRRRNKEASAKYRAKKNQQHYEMHSMITAMTNENEILQRQLEGLKEENARLKAVCDRLRGKMIAEKMLKKLFKSAPPLHSNSKQAISASATE